MEQELSEYFSEAKQKLIFAYDLPNRVEGKRIVDTAEFLGYEEKRFVLHCYIRIMNRIPSKSEIDLQIKALESGDYSKIDILRIFANSDETREKKVHVILPEYELDELLAFYDRDFVENLYISLLKRYPDKEGFHIFLNKIRYEGKDRLDIIHDILISDEAKEKNPCLIIHGFEDAYRMHMDRQKKYNYPFIGKYIKLFSNLKYESDRLRTLSEQLYYVSDKLAVIEESMSP